MPSDHRTDFEPANVSKRARLAWLQKLVMRRNYLDHVAALIRKITGIKRLGIRNLIHDLNYKEVPRKKLDPELEAEMMAYFAPDVQKLGKLLDLDLRH